MWVRLFAVGGLIVCIVFAFALGSWYIMRELIPPRLTDREPYGRSHGRDS